MPANISLQEQRIERWRDQDPEGCIRRWRTREELERCIDDPQNLTPVHHGIRAMTPYTSTDLTGSRLITSRFTHVPHPDSRSYHRAANRPLALSRLITALRRDVVDPENVALVSTLQILKMIKDTDLRKLTWEPVRGGLWMVHGVRNVYAFHSLIRSTGAIASLAHCLIRPSAEASSTVSRTQLSEMIGSAAFRDISQKGEKDETPFQGIYLATTHLLRGLENELADPLNEEAMKRFESSSVVQSALEKMNHSLAVLELRSASQHEILTAFFLFVDNLETLLSDIDLYSESACHDATLAPQNARIQDPDLRALRKQSILVSSGMQAIYTALLAARAVHGADSECFINRPYCEVRDLANQDFPDAKIFIATLFASQPDKNTENRETLLKKIQEDLKGAIEKKDPVSLILDITLETDPTDMEFFLNGLKTYLGSGKLNLIFCKSYQKYAMLGTGKVMGGNVAMFNNADKTFAQAFNVILEKGAEPLMQSHQRHLMAHFLKYGHIAEMRFVKRCIKNSELIRTFFDKACLQETPDDVKLPLIPFTEEAIPPLEKMLKIPSLIGFGWNTSTMYWDWNRLSVGQESKETITETFYAAGRMLTNICAPKPCTPKVTENAAVAPNQPPKDRPSPPTLMIPQEDEVLKDLKSILLVPTESNLWLEDLWVFATRHANHPDALRDFALKALSWDHLWYHSVKNPKNKATDSDQERSAAFTTALMQGPFHALPKEQQTHLASRWILQLARGQTPIELGQDEARILLEVCARTPLSLEARAEAIASISDDVFEFWQEETRLAFIKALVQRYPVASSLKLLDACATCPYHLTNQKVLQSILSYLKKTVPTLDPRKLKIFSDPTLTHSRFEENQSDHKGLAHLFSIASTRAGIPVSHDFELPFFDIPRGIQKLENAKEAPCF